MLSARRRFFRWFKPSGTGKITCKLLNIENQVKRLSTFHEEAKESKIKVTESLESAKFSDFEKNITKKYEEINQLEKTIENLIEKHKSLLSDIENLERCSRRNCLVLHGVNENNDENTNEILIKTFCEELGVTIKEYDLDRSHRLGKPKRKDNKTSTHNCYIHPL